MHVIVAALIPNQSWRSLCYLYHLSDVCFICYISYYEGHITPTSVSKDDQYSVLRKHRGKMSRKEKEFEKR